MVRYVIHNLNLFIIYVPWYTTAWKAYQNSQSLAILVLKAPNVMISIWHSMVIVCDIVHHNWLEECTTSIQSSISEQIIYKFHILRINRITVPPPTQHYIQLSNNAEYMYMYVENQNIQSHVICTLEATGQLEPCPRKYPVSHTKDSCNCTCSPSRLS